jgi:hypothetical protein
MPLEVDRSVSHIWLAPLGDRLTANIQQMKELENGGRSSSISGVVFMALVKTGIHGPAHYSQ